MNGGGMNTIESTVPKEPSSFPLTGGVRIRSLWLVLVTALVCAPSLWYPFVFDDYQQIRMNGLIKSWSNLPLFFQSDVWRHLPGGSTSNYYRPMFQVYMLTVQSLVHYRVWAWHLFSIGIHAVIVVMVYRLAARFLKDDVLAWYAALLF